MKKKLGGIVALGALIALSLGAAGSGSASGTGIAAPAGTAAAQAPVTSPERFFGFPMGADRKIARWDKLVEYYRLLEKESAGKLTVTDMGPTEMGNPFLLVIITSPANHKALETLRRNNLKLADPRGIPEAEIRKIAAAGKPFVCMTMSMHASEIGGAQMAPGARLRPPHAERRRNAAHPRQRRFPPHPLLQSRRPDHGDRLVQQVCRHAL